MVESTSPSAAPSPAAEHENMLRERVQQEPGDFDALSALAVLCARTERLGEARDLLERAIALNGKDHRLHLSAGGMAANDGDLDAAEAAYRKALGLRADLPVAHVGLGQIAEMREQLSTAEEHFHEALKIDRENADAMLGLARLHLQQNHVEQAVQMFARVTQRHPKHARALAGYGQALMMRGMPDKAGRPLKRALELDPNLFTARLLLGHVELYRNDVGAAEKAYREVLQAQPSNADALAGLGDALRTQERFDEACLAYNAARRQQPEVETLTTLHATCLGAMGREAEAVEDLQRFITAHPHCHGPRMLLADIWRNQGQDDRVAAMWQDAADADATDTTAFAELALLHETRGDFEAAARAAAGSTGDDRPHVCLMRARVALRHGDHAAAQRELLALKGVDLPDFLKHDRLRLMGLVHDQAGRWAEAALAFREAHRLDADPLPPLKSAEELAPVIEPLLKEPELKNPRTEPPVLLLGLPGSAVQQVAALLADQPGTAVRRDRFAGQTDFFASDDSILIPMAQSQLGIQARRYARVQERNVGNKPKLVVDWLPVFDARSLPVAKRALPGVRAVIIDSDPKQAWLRWLAFGWQRKLRMRDARAAAHWWALARQQLDLAATHLPVLRVDGDALMQDPAGMCQDLAQFLGLDSLSPGENSREQERFSLGLPTRFPAGHENNYREVLADAFAALESGT